jgi:hypothetical protein
MGHTSQEGIMGMGRLAIEDHLALVSLGLASSVCVVFAASLAQVAHLDPVVKDLASSGEEI